MFSIREIILPKILVGKIRGDNLESIVVKKGKRRIRVVVKRCGFFERFIGLMFKNKETSNLLFDFSKNTKIKIHSYFVFFPFLAVWLDEKNKIIEYKIIKPFETLGVSPAKSYRILLEIPINSKNKKIIRFFDEKYK